MDLLDESKENIQPLKRGRNVSTLSTALQAQSDVDVYHQLMKEREQFEILVRSYSGDDPLKPWYDYVQWVEQNFPKHGKEGNLKVLLENCLSQFKDSEQYSQDVRFIDLWTRYMTFIDNPLEMYKQIHARGIGTYCAIFYQCWAEEFELANDMKRADQVYIEGMKRNAQPIEELKAAHNDFQVRVARSVLGQNPFAHQEKRYDERTALCTLRAHGRKRNVVDSTRVGNSIKNVTPGVLRPNSGIFPVEKRNDNGQLKISMFKDENYAFPDAIASTQVKPAVNIRKENINKENTLQPGRWNEGKFPKKSSSTVNGGFSNTLAIPRTPSFAVHTDENATTPKIHCPDIVVSNVLKVRRYVDDEEKSIPVALFEPADPSKRAMYPKDKVYCGGTEFSLEELRAIVYEKRYKRKKLDPVKIDSYIPIGLQDKISTESDKNVQHDSDSVKITEQSRSKRAESDYLLRSEPKSDDNFLSRQAVENNSVNKGEWKVFSDNYQEFQPKENGNFKDVLPDAKSIEEQVNSIPIAIFEPPDPSKVPMYRKNQVYCNGTEYSLEELRANEYLKCFSLNSRENEHLRSDVCKELPVLNNDICSSKISDEKLSCFITEKKSNSNSTIDTSRHIDTAKKDINESNKKLSFEVYVEDEEEINAKLRHNESSQGRQSEVVPKVKKISAPIPILPREPPFSGYLKTVKLIKERKESDELECPCVSENRQCDQSFTVNTKAVWNDVKDMWLSSPPRLNYLEDPKNESGGRNLIRKDTPSSLQKVNAPLKIYDDSVDSEKINKDSVVFTNNKTKCTPGNYENGKSNRDGGQDDMLFSHPQNVENTDRHPSSEEVKAPGAGFYIHADSFLEQAGNAVPPCGIPFVPSPGMTSIQKAALEGTENKENFHRESSKKKLCFSSNKSGKGILQPSQDIYCVPLEKQLEDVRLEQDATFSDETCCTEAFAKPLVSSTPMIQFRLKPLGTEERQTEDFDDHTTNYMNMCGRKIQTESNEMLISNQEQPPSLPRHSVGIDCGTRAVNCSPVPDQLSTIYENSETKKSNSLVAGDCSKMSEIYIAQKQSSNIKHPSTSHSKISELEFEDLDLEFRTLYAGIRQENASSFDKPIEFYSNNFRDQCLKNVNFPSERHRNNCVAEIGEWKYTQANGSIIVGKTNYVIGKIISETDGNLLLLACSRSPCCIRTESISHLWEHYIKEEIRLRLKDPSMVSYFVAAEKIHIYSNVIVSISPSHEDDISLQDILMKKYSMGTSIDEASVLGIVCKMIKIILHLHQCNIVHGNICTSSFLIKSMYDSQEMSLFLTGYGNAVDIDLLPKNSTFNATAKKIFSEMNSYKISPYQIDYVGLADALHYLIFFKPLDVCSRHGKWNICAPLPRDYENDLWYMLFEDLLNSSVVDLLNHLHKFERLLKSNFDKSSSRHLLSP